MSNKDQNTTKILNLIDFKDLDVYSTEDINLRYDKYLCELESIRKEAESDTNWNSRIQLQCAILYTSIKNHQEYLKSEGTDREEAQMNKIKEELIQIDFLISILMNLPSTGNIRIIEYVIEVIKNISDTKIKASKLRDILSLLTSKQNTEVREIALDIITKITNKKNKSYCISRLAPYLPKLYIYEALGFYKNELRNNISGLNFDGLVPYINETSTDNLLTIVEKIGEDSLKANTINKLIANIPESFYEKLLNITKIKKT